MVRKFTGIIAGWGLVAGLCHSAMAAESQPAANQAPDQRISIETQIDKQPARLLFDTGASFTSLFASSTNRLGLVSETNRMAKIAGHDVSIGLTRHVEVTLLGKSGSTKLPILPFPAPGEFDGVLGWMTLGDNPFYIDAEVRRIRSVTKLPDAGWQSWPLDTNSTQLFFTVTEESKPLGRVFVDTGSPIGLRISSKLWEAWKMQNPKAGVTLASYRYAVGETMAHELAYAAEYRLGDLMLRDVDIGPIPEAKDGKAIGTDGKEFIATIGMRGLQHLRMIVNRSAREVLTHTISPLPQHNRLGAVFPLKQPVGRIAQVLENSPAHKAGLKTGDILISINGSDFSQPQSNPESFLTQPAGSKLLIKVKRDDAVHEYSILLEDMIP